MMNGFVFVVLGGAVFLMAILVIGAFSGSKNTNRFKSRLARVGGASVDALAADKSKTQSSVRRSTTDSAIPLFDRLIKALMPNPDKLRARLAKTGKTTTLGEYLLINLLLIFVFALLFRFALSWPPTVAIFLGVAFGFFVPHYAVGRMGNRRVRKFLASFPEAIDTLCRGLRAGLPITESIAAVGNEMPDPIGIEFRRISDGVRMGRTLEESMTEVAKRIDTPEFSFLIISMAIQKETGGNLAETLGNLADLLRKRRQLRLKIRAMSSEARASAMILTALPFLLFGLLIAINYEYMSVMFVTLKGKVMLSFAAFMIASGWGVMSKMINFEL